MYSNLCLNSRETVPLTLRMFLNLAVILRSFSSVTCTYSIYSLWMNGVLYMCGKGGKSDIAMQEDICIYLCLYCIYSYSACLHISMIGRSHTLPSYRENIYCKNIGPTIWKTQKIIMKTIYFLTKVYAYRGSLDEIKGCGL